MTAAPVTVQPGESFRYYDGTIYWNDFPEIQAYLNHLATGHSTNDWVTLLDGYPPAQRLLSLNCGEGWVERDLHKRGYARSVVGLDISEDLLERARRLAAQQGVTADYRIADANTTSLAGLDFDHVLNHAALHHVAYIDRLVREVLVHMPEHGLLINYDYVGPHRNQYGWQAWSRMIELWDEMPPQLRTDLAYPPLEAMLASDPTEAVHSELIVDTLQRYFDIVEMRALGGAIAYQLLWNNVGLHQARETWHGAYWLDRIIEADREFAAGKIENSLFAVLLCRPRKAVLNETGQLALWTKEENEREQRAMSNGRRYYPRGALEIIYANRKAR
jgi:SAM-dependent methyltransferase